MVTLRSILPAETIGVRTFLNFLTLERSGGNSAAGNHFALVNARADAGCKPGIDLAELHVRFRQGHTFHAAHFGVGREQQLQLCFEWNFEGVLAERTLPTIHVGFFRWKNNVAPFCQRPLKPGSVSAWSKGIWWHY